MKKKKKLKILVLERVYLDLFLGEYSQVSTIKDVFSSKACGTIHESDDGPLTSCFFVFGLFLTYSSLCASLQLGTLGHEN